MNESSDKSSINITTKNYETLLPLMVVEAISAQGASFNLMSVQMIDQGWAWLVSCRKALVWKFKESKEPRSVKTRRMLSPCFELQLPQTDLHHRADLINIFFMPQNMNVSIRATTIPAAIAISPEGIVRFWSKIANENFTELCVSDTPGQEFCSLIPITVFEYVLATTTGSVYVLTINIMAHDSKSIISCSSLCQPSSILSGIGRRMTNLFFGPMDGGVVASENKRPIITVPKYSQSTIDTTGSTDRPFFVMNSTFKLRQWSRTNEGPYSVNQLIREWDLQRNIYNELISELGLAQSDHISFWPIDMITTKSNELLMLIATLDATRENSIFYATCVFNPYQVGDGITSLDVLKSHSWQYTNEQEDQLLSLKFLARRVDNPDSLCFIYDRKFLFLIKANEDIVDAIDYANQDDAILGAGIVDNHPILFTQRDGLTHIIPSYCNRSRLNETSIQLDPPLLTERPVSSSTMLSTTASTVAPASTSKPNKSIQQLIRKNDTSLRHQSMRSEAVSIRADPMLVDIDMEEESGNLENIEQQVRQPRNVINLDQSILSKSTLDQSSALNKSLSANQSMSRRKEDEVNEILRDNKEFEWVQMIDSKNYSLASELLAKLAEESETLKDRKETLIALSKLSKMAE